jgi:uncharacterized cupin superfamily protein
MSAALCAETRAGMLSASGSPMTIASTPARIEYTPFAVGQLSAYPDSASELDLGDQLTIPPEQVLDGMPRFRVRLIHMTSDEKYPTVLWDCTAGKFRWFFDCDEVVHILDGEVIVHEDNGRVSTLRAGDTALFPKGVTNVWEVPSYVRKLAVHRLSAPSPLERLKQSLSGIKKTAKGALARLTL